MLSIIFIFGAKYLIICSLLVAGIYFLKSDAVMRKKIMMFLLISLPLTYIVGLAAGHFYSNPRPFVVGGFKPLIAHEADNGFPSDHVLLAAALAAAWMFFDRKYAIWLWGITVFIALSRMYVGVHHLLDVAASMGIALLCAIIVHKLWKRINF